MENPQLRADFVEAINTDHPCDSSSCDIAMARDVGFEYVAAKMLAGSTETPAVDALITEVGADQFAALEADEFTDWVEWYHVNTRACRACSTHVHNDSVVCGNCLAELPEVA